MTNATTRVLIYGAGGHARVVADLVRTLDAAELVAVVDDDPQPGQSCGGVEVEAWETFDRSRIDAAIVAVGDNRARAQVAERLVAAGLSFFTAVHPSATVASDVRLGAGSVVMAGAILQCGTTVGRHSIVNTGATVDHDGCLGDSVHIAPGCHLAGSVTVEDGAFLGIGSVVIPGRIVATNAVVGAGSVVLRDVEPDCTVVGQPARVIERHA